MLTVRRRHTSDLSPLIGVNELRIAAVEVNSFKENTNFLSIYILYIILSQDRGKSKLCYLYVSKKKYIWSLDSVKAFPKRSLYAKYCAML